MERDSIRGKLLWAKKYVKRINYLKLDYIVRIRTVGLKPNKYLTKWPKFCIKGLIDRENPKLSIKTKQNEAINNFWPSS